MKISTSTYYADSKVSRAEKEEFEADIRGKIEYIRTEMKGAGYRQLLSSQALWDKNWREAPQENHQGERASDTP